MRTEVPFQLAGGDNPLILIPAVVNGRGPLPFVLDTGASVCLLTPERARELGVAARETRDGHGAAGRLRVEMSELDSLAVGDLRRESVRVAMTADLERIGAAIGARVDGVVGWSFFRDCRIEIDYGALRLAFDSDATFEFPAGIAGAPTLSFTLAAPSKPLAVVSALVNGRGPYAFAVDTGASTTVVAESLGRELDLPTAPTPALTGGGGTVAATAARLATLALGPIQLRDVDVAVSDFLTQLSEAIGTRLDGVIGYNVLRGFHVAIDYPRGLLTLAPRD